MTLKRQGGVKLASWSHLPLTALGALSSGSLRFSRSPAPARLAGPADDPAAERKRIASGVYVTTCTPVI